MVEENQQLDMIEQAKQAAERLEKANKEMQELIKKREEIETRSILGGRTTAGETIQPVKVETPKEYAARVMRGAL